MSDNPDTRDPLDGYVQKGALTGRTGKPPHADPPHKTHFNLPTSVVEELEVYTLDPIKNKPFHGARGKIITLLLKEFFKAVKEGRDEIDIGHIRRYMLGLWERR